MTQMNLNLTRRSLIAGGSAAGLGATFGGGAVPAAAPLLGVLRPEIYRFELGRFEVMTVLDGVRAVAKVYPIFGQNIAPDELAAHLEANFLPADRMEIPFTPTVVNTGREVILFDTGNGEGGRPGAGNTRAALTAAGIAPEQVDIVVITHFHGDHIKGITEAGAPAYPNARYVTGAREYDFWTDAGLLSDDRLKGRAELVRQKVVPFAEKMRFISPGDSVVSGIEAIGAFGHTPGHMAYHLESEGRRLVLAADTSNHYVASLQKPDWHVVFDMDKEAAVATRKALFGMIAADRVPFIGYHMPPPAAGFIEEIAGGFRFVAVSYQLTL